MLDFPPPTIADFGPFHPLPINLNENLYLQAMSRWQECRRQWRQLMASHSPSISVEWWDARAPYSALSRRELALALYRQHFEAACQIACAEATITVEQLRTLSAISDPPDDVSSGLHVTRPSFSDGRQTWPGTLNIRLTVDQTTRHVLYVPGRPQALMLFNSLAELGKWLFDQRQSASAPPASAIVLDYIPLSDDPLRQNWLALLNQTLSAGDHPPEFALATLFAETPTRPADEAQTEADPAPFALLDPDIPRPLRSAALARERAALDALLGKEVSVATDHPLRLTLKRQFEALSLAEQASQTSALALFESARPQQMLELLHSSNVHYHTLHQARRDGLRAEADLQRALNQLGASDHRRLMTVLDATDQKARASEVMVARVTLSVTEGGNSYSEELAGVLVIASPGDENTAMDQGLLLYWPGQSGGLQHFTSRRALEAALFKRAAGDRHTAIHLTPLSGDPLTWALQQQLYSCEQQAVQIIREHLDPGERDAALQRLQALSITLLTVPVVAARELAYAQRQEQERAAELASALPAWLRQLDVSQRPRLQALIEQYLDATQRAHDLLQRDLPSRETFARQRIDERLRLDFSLHENTRVELELPDSTSWKKVVMEGAAPGTPQRNVLIPGPDRRTMTLVELALSNIDQALWWRLSFLRLNISSDVEADRQALSSGLTTAYLRRLVTELDVAGRYEQRLRETFLGSPSASAFATAWRRECLTEPWRLMLKLQGEFALLQGQIDAQGKQVLDIATDASTAAVYAQDGKNIVLLPAHLTVGGEDTAGQGSSTLAGVTFIVEQTQGLTLLHLPDNPEGDGLRQFDSLEQARRNLFNRCGKNSMVDYLAGRTVSGGFASHVSRINEAQRRNFDALIGIGMKWPATTSLSEHLLNVHMGRLLEAHRDSSRSNDALFLEQQALQSGAVFTYIKMALGLLPFVGTALGVYDAWNSANRAVAAFLCGEVGQGLAEVEAVLLALIDAAMDVLPVVATGPDSLRTLARAVTRRRHLVAAASTPGALRPLPRRQARRAAEQFKGYEYEHEISLADVQPGTQGVYRQVYRHAEGDFILSQGRVYRVQLSDTHRGWRLAGTRTRGYKMPIALDESGQWNTHYAVHGTLMDGGGAGGGAALGHLANGMDPLWPEAIRRWLPRWWTDRHLRRQLTLSHTVDHDMARLQTQTTTTNASLERYNATAVQQRQPLRDGLDRACLADIELAEHSYQNLEQLLPLSHGQKRRQIKYMQSQSASVVTDRALYRVHFTKDRLLEYLDRIDQLLKLSDATPATDTRRHLDLMRQRKTLRSTFLTEFARAYSQLEQVNLWHPRMTDQTHRARIAADVASMNSTFSPANQRYLNAAHRLELITHPDAIDDATWSYFHVQMKKARTEIGRAMFTQHNLTSVKANPTQRVRVLEECLTIYTQFRRDLNAWTLGYPQHLDFEHVAPFLDHLARLEEHARHALRNRNVSPAGQPASDKRLFETDDNRLLVGVEQTDPVTRQKRFTIEGADGHTETWLPRSSGKYHLAEPAAPLQTATTTPLPPLLAEARKRLDAAPAYQNKIEGYARQDMLPVDLEHMMLSEASELSVRATTLEGLSPREPLIRQLHDQASELKRLGRRLRIEQTLNSQTPSEGYLDYLLTQEVVDIRKETGLRDLGKRTDGTRDFLQEYEVRDLTRQPPQTLWYAHFHYRSAKAPFTDFVKAHLKLPAQRNLGLQWQQAQARSGIEVESIWRGDIGRSMALKHFSTAG